MAKAPVHEIRYGLIVARIWRRASRVRVRHTVAVTRLFRDGDVWKHSSRFTRDDLPVIRFVLDQVHTWIYQHGGSGEDINHQSSGESEVRQSTAKGRNDVEGPDPTRPLTR